MICGASLQYAAERLTVVTGTSFGHEVIELGTIPISSIVAMGRGFGAQVVRGISSLVLGSFVEMAVKRSTSATHCDDSTLVVLCTRGSRLAFRLVVHVAFAPLARV